MKASVLVITCNQEAFVRQAVESALAQRTSFEFEIVVGHDASTDGTAAVLEDLLRTAPPGRLRVFHRPQRLGVVGNFLETLRECRGEYVALLEGDDYWIHPEKLARQVKYLDDHPEVSQCFHPVRFLKRDGTYSDAAPTFPADKEFYTTDELIYPHLVSTCSVVSRNDRATELADWVEGMPGGDWIRTVFHSTRGPVACLPQVMGVYRCEGGVSTSLSSDRLREASIKILQRLATKLGPEHHARIERALRLLESPVEDTAPRTAPVRPRTWTKRAKDWASRIPGVRKLRRKVRSFRKRWLGKPEAAVPVRPCVEARSDGSPCVEASRPLPAAPAGRGRSLALLGGRPAFDEVRHVGRPNLGSKGEFFARLSEMWDRKRLTNDGPLVQEFEGRIAEMCEVRHAVAVANATLGLQLVLRGLDLRGEVICPSFTFAATAHAVAWEGLTPVFADVDPRTHNLDPVAVEACLSPRTCAVLGVHLWGRPCAIEPLTELSRRHGLKLIFDSAHAIGCTHGGRPLGGRGSAEVFSFHGTKVLSAGEGGCITTDDDALAERLRRLRNFGFAGLDRVVSLGTNAKLSELHAALGLTNLAALPEFVAVNHAHDRRYRERLGRLPGLTLLEYDPRERNTRQYVVVEVDDARCGLTRDDLIAVLAAENVAARRYFYPGCERMPPYAGRTKRPLPHSEALAERLLALPTGTGMSEEDVEAVCGILAVALDRAAEVRGAFAQRASRTAA